MYAGLLLLTAFAGGQIANAAVPYYPEVMRGETQPPAFVPRQVIDGEWPGANWDPDSWHHKEGSSSHKTSHKTTIESKHHTLTRNPATSSKKHNKSTHKPSPRPTHHPSSENHKTSHRVSPHHPVHKSTDHPKTTHHPTPQHHKSSHHSVHETSKHPKASHHPQPTHKAHPSTKHHPSQPPSHLKAPPPGYGNSYAGMVINQHNLHRRNHSAPAIAWDDDLAEIAHTIAFTCTFAHSMNVAGGGYGQNIAAGTPPQGIPAVITNEFYNHEEPWYHGLYGEANPSMTNFEHWGHFSQLVWKASTHVGCATVHCPGGVADAGSNVDPFFTVCNYKPPGNFAGQYGKNVGRPLGHPNVNIQKPGGKW